MKNKKLIKALEQIATGEIVGTKKDYKTTVEIMRNIAKDALNESINKPENAKCCHCKKGKSGFYFCSGNC